MTLSSSSGQRNALQKVDCSFPLSFFSRDVSDHRSEVLSGDNGKFEDTLQLASDDRLSEMSIALCGDVRQRRPRRPTGVRAKECVTVRRRRWEEYRKVRARQGPTGAATDYCAWQLWEDEATPTRTTRSRSGRVCKLDGDSDERDDTACVLVRGQCRPCSRGLLV